MEAVILAGGFGTRLQKVVADVPKPMAPIHGRPFLEILLDDLSRKGVTHVVLAVGYKKECVIEHFGTLYKNIQIEYSVEDKPLFTGGAIKQALRFCREDYVMVLNGDTFFDVNLMAMSSQAVKSGSPLTIAVKEMFDFDRYGKLRIENDRILAFEEKVFAKQGYINGGIYCLQRDALTSIEQEAFSFEMDFAEKYCDKFLIRAFVSNGYFIDIGIPEEYERAQQDL
jgi:D-glycero-alpha-D-manno-heptose 1-phosphate guanylyltransferase